VSQKAIFFQNEKILIIKDSVFTTESISPNSIDLIVTSPPYNVDIKYNSHDDRLSYEDYKEFSRDWMSRCYDWLKDDGRFCLNIPLDKNKGGKQSVGADLTCIAKEIGFKYHSTIIWNEGNISRRTAWGSWSSASAPYIIAPVELIVVFYKKTWKKISGSKKSTIEPKDFQDWTNGLWTFSGESKNKIGHPAPFPVELPRRCIQLFSYEGDTVLDPFLGSGSTLIASYLAGRKGIGIEIDKNYCEIALERLKKEVGVEPLLTKIDSVFQYFKGNPNRDISHTEVREWINTEYKEKTGSVIKHFDRKIRNLCERGMLIPVREGIYRYEPPFK